MKRICMAAALVLAASAQAADLPKEGSFDFTACWAGTSNLVAFSKTHWANTFEMTGSTRSNPPGGMFDKNSFRCIGTNASFEKKLQFLTVCEGVDRDGDKRLTHFETGADGKTVRRFVAGTGKYEGMIETSAGIEPLGPFPTAKPGTFQNCNRQTGTYKLK
ncbi:MAG: hypothetical protein WD886_07700 [Burkholderiales bacterium]